MVKRSILCVSVRGRKMHDFFRLTLCSEITETKEEREEGKRSLCSMVSHVCADRSADLSLSGLDSVGRPPAHTGLWAISA